MRNHFDRDRLPDIYTYYCQRLNKFKIAPIGAKATAQCPFHDDKHPSLSIKLTSGRFNCFACGAKGSGILEFHMKLYGLSFKDAVYELGAWSE